MQQLHRLPFSFAVSLQRSEAVYSPSQPSFSLSLREGQVVRRSWSKAAVVVSLLGEEAERIHLEGVEERRDQVEVEAETGFLQV